MPSRGSRCPGMVKLRCTTCHYWFAASAPDVETCPDCALRLRRPAPVEQQQQQEAA